MHVIFNLKHPVFKNQIAGLHTQPDSVHPVHSTVRAWVAPSFCTRRLQLGRQHHLTPRPSHQTTLRTCLHSHALSRLPGQRDRTQPDVGSWSHSMLQYQGSQNNLRPDGPASQPNCSRTLPANNTLSPSGLPWAARCCGESLVCASEDMPASSVGI